MASNKWTPVDGAPKGDEYNWKSPSGNTQHEEQTVAPGDLMIKPEDLSLKPTLSPEQSGIQWGQDAWNFTNAPDQNWYVFGTIED